MTPEIKQLQDRVAYLEGVIFGLTKSDRYTIGRTMQFNDGRNIQTALTTGTKIGTGATQKIGFWGAAPVVQQTVPATTAASIIATLKTIGIFAP